MKDTNMTNRKTIIKASLAAVLALGTIAGATAPASASGISFSFSNHHSGFSFGNNGHHFQQHREIGRGNARRILRHAGFQGISFLQERQRVYVFEAFGSNGKRRVVINKFNGRIIR